MSATVFVQHRSQGFWAYDVALGILLKFLIDEARTWPDQHDRVWLDDAIAHWRVNAVVSDFAFVLPDSWNDRQRGVVMRVVRAACKRLDDHGSVTDLEAESWDVLDGTGVFTRGDSNVATAPVIELGEAIISLLSGDLAVAPEGHSWLFGTNRGRTTLRKREA